jgi:hypothetical protein
MAILAMDCRQYRSMTASDFDHAEDLFFPSLTGVDEDSA